MLSPGWEWGRGGELVVSNKVVVQAFLAYTRNVYLSLLQTLYVEKHDNREQIQSLEPVSET